MRTAVAVQLESGCQTLGMGEIFICANAWGFMSQAQEEDEDKVSENDISPI